MPASKSSTDGKPRKGYEKKAQVGDIIVMTGGRIGKDGIHGATFSSEALHEGSPAPAAESLLPETAPHLEEPPADPPLEQGSLFDS